jgi:hypothetical protein
MYILLLYVGTVDDDLYTMYVHTTPDTYTLSECTCEH